MRTTLVFLLAAASAAAGDAKTRTIEGVRWHESLDGALAESARKEKPVLHLRMLGDLAGKT